MPKEIPRIYSIFCPDSLPRLFKDESERHEEPSWVLLPLPRTHSEIRLVAGAFSHFGKCGHSPREIMLTGETKDEQEPQRLEKGGGGGAAPLKRPPADPGSVCAARIWLRNEENGGKQPISGRRIGH